MKSQINLASCNPMHYKKLLKLSKIRNVLSEIAISAAAKLSQLLLSEKYPNSKLIDFTLKNLNERFLDTQYNLSKIFCPRVRLMLIRVLSSF